MGKKLTVPAEVTGVFGTCQEQEPVDRRVTVMRSCVCRYADLVMYARPVILTLGNSVISPPNTFPVNVTALAYHSNSELPFMNQMH